MTIPVIKGNIIMTNKTPMLIRSILGFSKHLLPETTDVLSKNELKI